MLTHVNSKNLPKMVDVSDKQKTKRLARAQAQVELPKDIIDLFDGKEIQSNKGPVFNTAIIAATMAVKKTSDLIPFCHPLAIQTCNIDISLKGSLVEILCEVGVFDKTGVEMEALTGASVAALTIYDMCKAVSSDMVILKTELLNKTGGKSDK